jgi:hypothetical protein
VSVLKKFRKAAQNRGDEGESVSSAPKRKHGLRNERRSWEREGAWRIDNHGDYWWFDGDQLDDLDDINKSIDDDAEFWEAFADYVHENGITNTRSSSSKKSNDDDSWSSYKWTDNLKGDKGSSYSSYWNPWSKGTYKWSADINIRVALAMRAVQTTVQIIDDSGVRMSVVPSTEMERTVAFTDFQKNRIVISAKPIGDSKLNEGEAIDVMTGYGLHEASHSKYTRQVWDQLTKPSELKPLSVAGMCGNLLEDVRIERLTSEDFPGFAPYFEKTNAYMWPEVKPPKDYGPDLTSKMNAAIAIVKWPVDSAKATARYPEEVEWWTQWNAAFKEDGSNLRERVEAALAHLRDATEEEKQKGESKEDDRAESGESGGASDEMDEQAQREEDAAQAMEQAMKDFAERKGISQFCSHDGEPLDGMNAEQVQKLVDEELTKEEIEIRLHKGNAVAPVFVSRPMEDYASKAEYSAKSDPALNLYKSALVFRPVDPHWSIKLQREGEIDDDEIWRWAADDWRVFEERKIPHDPKVRIGLLVDISGSMHGRKLDSAVKMARLFVEALTSIHGVTPYVWAHTGDIGEDGSQVYRVWEPGDPMTRLGLLKTLDNGNNYDGHAIAYVCKQLAETALPDEQKLLVVLSDGLPSGGLGYGGDEGMQHVRFAVEDAQKQKDIRVLQIAIDTSIDEARQRKMFDEFITFKAGDSLDSVPKRLTRWLEKAI